MKQEASRTPPAGLDDNCVGYQNQAKQARGEDETSESRWHDEGEEKPAECERQDLGLGPG
jgi:hypothetical protein